MSAQHGTGGAGEAGDIRMAPPIEMLRSFAKYFSTHDDPGLFSPTRSNYPRQGEMPPTSKSLESVDRALSGEISSAQ